MNAKETLIVFFSYTFSSADAFSQFIHGNKYTIEILPLRNFVYLAGTVLHTFGVLFLSSLALSHLLVDHASTAAQLKRRFNEVGNVSSELFIIA